MTSVINVLNDIFWGYLLIYGLLAVGIFFTVRLGFPQLRHPGEFFGSILTAGEKDSAGITPFQALCTTLASRVGTGNIAGVAVALYLGGAGAIFWMWVVAALGMATAFAESTLAQLYKVRDASGTYRGGPAFYMSAALNARWAGKIFSIALILSFGLVFNAVQANSIADAMQGAFGLDKLATGLVLAVLTGVIIFGGVRRVARVAGLVVPFMAISYVLVALYVILTHLGHVPDVLWMIVKSAFGLQEAAGGAAGSLAAAMLNGTKRGLFSNEAGMGSAPNGAAIATPAPHHPCSQGFVQALGVFIDTLVICTCTALMILLSDLLTPGSGLTGVQLTQAAVEAHVGGWGKSFVAIAIFFFAFTSIIGNYVYAENSMIFLGLGKRAGIATLRLAGLAMVVWGACESVGTVFDAADASMGLMATINLIAIVLLSGTVVKLSRDYFGQKQAHGKPVFHAADYPELSGRIDTSIWSR